MVFILAIVWQIVSYFSLPHLVELPGIIESWLTYKGLIYYKDFATFHFPLGRWIMLPFYLASNWNLEAGPLVALLSSIVVIWLLSSLFKRFFSIKGASIAIIFFVIFNLYFATGIVFYHEMFIGLLLLVCLYLLLQIYKDKFKNYTASFLLGIMLSITLLSVQIAAITIAAFAQAYLLLARDVQIKRTVFIRSTLSATIGVFLPILIFVAYFVEHNALSEMIFWNIDYYKTYSGEYEKLSFISLPWIELVAFYIPLVTLLIINFKNLLSKVVNKFDLAFLVLSLSTIPFIFYSVFHFHHVSYALPLFSVFAGYSYVRLSKPKYIKAIFLASFTVLVFASIIPWYWNRIQLNRPLKVVNDTYPGDGMYESAQWIKNNTSDDSKILVAGDPLFYFRSERIPSSKHMYVSPYNWEPFNLIMPEVNSNPPDYWIIDTNFMTRLEKEYKKSSIVDYIRQQLNLCYSKKFADLNWQVWIRKCK